MTESIAERIKAARAAANLTQTDLATELGVTQSTVNRWESGRHDPSRDVTSRIATATGVSTAWLELGGKSGGPADHGASAAGGVDPRFSRVMRSVDNTTLAFQGVPGAYSHLACRNALPMMTPKSCASFADAFAAVEHGDAGLAMIPIENSLGGRVADIHHILPESPLYIVAEHFQPVHHHLMAPPGATLEGIREAHSHPQALAQCRKTLRELGIKPVAHADTAGAAKEIAERGDPSIAAIASSLAADTYKLEPLRSRVEDQIGNVTRFVVMARTRIEPDPSEGGCMTSFLFTVRSVPASLYKCLGGFATNGVNMIKLESYISATDYSVARFYAEIEGHPSDKHVDRALEELQFFTSRVKVLGTYRMSPFRTSDG